jgi:uncharacterized protein YndB with AHSA1/START domain
MKETFTAKATFTFHAPIEKVWDALINPEKIKQYFFGTDFVANWKVGETIYFRGIWEGKPYEDKGIVKSYEANKSLSYLYRSSWDELPDVIENYLLIRYDVSASENGTELVICQEARSEEQAQHSEGNWNGIMEGMRKIVEV